MQVSSRANETRCFFHEIASRLRETLLFRVKEDGTEPPGTLCELEGGSQTAWTGDGPKLSIFFVHPLRQNGMKNLAQNSGRALRAH